MIFSEELLFLKNSYVQIFCKNSFIVKVSPLSYDLERKNKVFTSNTYISLLRSIVDQNSLEFDKSGHRVNIKIKLLKQINEFTIDTIEIFIKDQIISNQKS